MPRDIRDGDTYVDPSKTNEGTREFSGYPVFPGGYPYPYNSEDIVYPGLLRAAGSAIDISDHYNIKGGATYVSPSSEDDDSQHFVVDKSKHFIRDYNDPASNQYNIPHSRPAHDAATEYSRWFDVDSKNRDSTVMSEMYGERPVFSGSVTLVNPFGDRTKANIIELGLERMEIDRTTLAGVKSNNSEQIPTKYPPLSPLHPFTRINNFSNFNVTHTAKQAVYRAYNRTRIPIADVEFRKGFSHMFFSRPECYVMYMDKGMPKLCEQALYDEDFSSLYSRLPQVVQLLAPAYVTGSSSNHHQFTDNWNYLLSNRALGISIGEETLSQKESVTKSAEGYTIVPGLHLESRTGSTINISFRDTKDLEVYEFIKIWMMYIHKRARGIFYPPYNGYAYHNNFINIHETQVLSNNVELERGLHPYDRALEYTASLFNFITNEADSKIIYWCKYYGLYPVSVNVSLSSENNAAITGSDGIRTEVSFRYQYKLPGVNKSLVEFNYNSGICDYLGRSKLNVASDKQHKLNYSAPFLLRDSSSTNHRAEPTSVITDYLGAAGMFTGIPFVLMAKTGFNPVRELNGEAEPIVSPVLRFMDITDEKLNNLLNLGYTNIMEDTSMADIARVK